VARVTLDADVVIALLDPADSQHRLAVEELDPLMAARDELLIGASAYAETLVRPLQNGTAATVDDFLDAARIRIVAVDRSIAHRAARLRAATPSLRLPDAMSLATAQANNATLLTFDLRLQRLANQDESSGGRDQ
jgi:predicted nucleic acid-binding protein